MTLIKPSFIENLLNTFFNLDPDRPKYYNLVFRLGRSIFLQLGFNEKAEKLVEMISEKLEKPFKSPLFAILEAYYNPRFLFSRIAYCKVGEGIDARQVTRYEMTVVLEEIKNWLYDEITALTPYIRFTRTSEIIA